MCPDPSILSAYRDGEVPSPWAERLAAHVSSCAECARKLASLEELSALLASEPSRATVDAAEAAVAARLETAVSKAPAAAGKPWKRYFVVPLPLAAAAALLVAALPVAVVMARLLPGKPAAVASQARPLPSSSGVIPVSADPALAADQAGEFADFSALLDYLNAQEGYIRITVDIPPNRNIVPGGPAEIRKVSIPAEGADR